MTLRKEQFHTHKPINGIRFSLDMQQQQKKKKKNDRIVSYSIEPEYISLVSTMHALMANYRRRLYAACHAMMSCHKIVRE